MRTAEEKIRLIDNFLENGGCCTSSEIYSRLKAIIKDEPTFLISNLDSNGTRSPIRRFTNKAALKLLINRLIDEDCKEIIVSIES